MNSRNLVFLTAALCMSAFHITVAQTVVDVHVGYSPAQDIGSQAIRVNYIEGMGNALLRPSRQSSGFTAGLGITHDLSSGFFLKGEVQYVNSRNDYEMYAIQQSSERTSALMFYESNHVISVPLSVGVKLGSFRVLSGVNANAQVKSTTTMSNLEDFSSSSSSIYMGWQAGLGYDIGNFGLEIRYSQDFRNHGQGYSIADKQLVYYGNRIRWTMLAKYYIGRK